MQKTGAAEKCEGRDCGCLITSAWTDFERDALSFLGVRKRVRIACIIDLHSRRTFNADIWSIFWIKNSIPISHVHWNIKQPLNIKPRSYLVLRFENQITELFDKLLLSSKFEK